MRHGWMLARPASWGSLLLICVGASTFAADEPLPDSRLGHRTAPLLLLSRPDVRADLGLDPAQTAAAERAIGAIYPQANALRKKPNTEDTIRARRSIDHAMQDWIETHLSEAQQERLIEIDLQWEGPSALVSRAIVREALNLSVEQIKLIQEAIKRRDLARTEGHVDAETMLAETSLASLSPSQRDGWRRMMGKPFTPRIVTASSR